MKIMKTNILLISVFFILFSGKMVSGLDEETHENINKTVAEMTLTNGFSLNDYLTNQLNFASGIKEEFKNEEVKEVKEVLQWLEYGGRYEDSPFYSRSINHFHDPITDKGYHYIIDLGWSSTEWALMDLKTQDPGGYYSWNDVMGYYKEALTSPDENTRNTNFANTFRGIGQLMHLVQDASSPAHARNDQHPEYNYETWVQEKRDNDDISDYNPVFFSGEINDIASFIDTDRYSGTNPEITDGTDIGLSEYANANFFSNGTNATEDASFTYPQITEDTRMVWRDFINPNINSGNPYLRLYYIKDYDGETNGGNGYRLSAVDYLDYYVMNYGVMKTESIPLLDHNVYSDYADLLLPRAIGYSAGVLNYFFRGEIDLVPAEAPNIGYVIENKSTEEMTGTFELWYDRIDENDNVVRTRLWRDILTIGTVSSENNKSEIISYEFKALEDADEPGDYILVFEGIMGSEEGAIVGKVIDPYWEPWGQTVCEIHTWEVFYVDEEGYDYASCPDLSNSVNDTGHIGETWTLNEGVLNHVLDGGYDYSNYKLSSLQLKNVNIEATKMKIKLSAEVLGADYGDFGSLIYFWMQGVNSTYAQFFLDYNFSIDLDDWRSETYILGDNGGEEQILNLSDYGFNDENIKYIFFDVWCGPQVQCNYSLDYIDFYTDIPIVSEED